MALYVRMALYLIFGIIAGNGLAVYDANEGTLTFHVDQLEPVLTGLAGYFMTFVVGRFAKAKGGAS